MTKSKPKLCHHPEVISQILGNEAVLLHLKTEVYYTLDETAMRIWQLIGEYEGDQQIIVSRMQDEFDVDETTLKTDLKRIIEEFSQEGLLDIEH